MEPTLPSNDLSCVTDSDCAAKNVGNCCGQYPICVNANFCPDLDGVNEYCQSTGMSSVCGWPTIHACVCKEGSCLGVQCDITTELCGGYQGSEVVPTWPSLIALDVNLPYKDEACNTNGSVRIASPNASPTPPTSTASSKLALSPTCLLIAVFIALVLQIKRH